MYSRVSLIVPCDTTLFIWYLIFIQLHNYNRRANSIRQTPRYPNWRREDESVTPLLITNPTPRPPSGQRSANTCIFLHIPVITVWSIDSSESANSHWLLQAGWHDAIQANFNASCHRLTSALLLSTSHTPRPPSGQGSANFCTFQPTPETTVWLTDSSESANSHNELWQPLCATTSGSFR